uniref:Uncharacterized protein n=1 Tax=Marseillevirus LCMAC201 TaxID=2506605 RepID=A0A481YW51_9VIRU|nr:MAG: hypothetical protein LCMAC201_01520 [Marseillevirus LCMAC201]
MKIKFYGVFKESSFEALQGDPKVTMNVKCNTFPHIYNRVGVKFGSMVFPVNYVSFNGGGSQSIDLDYSIATRIGRELSKDESKTIKGLKSEMNMLYGNMFDRHWI